MKDPLQTSQTPYEILEVERGIDSAALKTAYFKSLAKRKYKQAEIKAAFDKLRQPVERARMDLTQYDDRALSNFTLGLHEELRLLNPANRGYTAGDWENRLKEVFPDTGMIHSLSVLWYWWAEFEEQRFREIFEAFIKSKATTDGKTSKKALLRELCKSKGYACDPDNWVNCTHGDCHWLNDCSSSAPPLEQMWKKVIAYWSTLAVVPDFWESFKDLSEADRKKLRDSFLGSLRDRLLDLAQQYSMMRRDRNNEEAQENIANIPWGWGKMADALQQALLDAGIRSLGDILRAGEEKMCKVKGINRDKAKQILELARKMRLLNADLPEEYRRLAQLLATERKTAETLDEGTVTVVRKNGKKLCGGVIMLGILGFLEHVKKAVTIELQKRSDHPRLNALKQHLSPFISIILLLEEQKAESALETIECLSDDERKSDEVADLRARALTIIASKQMSVEKAEEALDSWQTAIGQARSEPVRQQIKSEIVKGVQQRVAALRDQHDKAIAILEKTIKIVSDDTLQRTLGDRLAMRAVDTIKKSQKQGIEPAKILPSLENAVADLERAAGYGSGIASQNLQAARGLLKSVQSGMMSLSPEVLEYVRQAGEVARCEKWAEAIKLLREAIFKAGRNVPEELKKNLAVCLTNDAIKKANDAIEMFGEAAREHKGAIESFFARCKSSWGSEYDCAHCGKHRYLMNQWATVNLPDHGQIMLCAECAAEFKSLLDSKPRPGALTIELLQTAWDELREAMYLDPGSEHPAKQKEQLAEMASQLGITLSDHEKIPQFPATNKAVNPKPPAGLNKPSSGTSALSKLMSWLKKRLSLNIAIAAVLESAYLTGDVILRFKFVS